MTVGSIMGQHCAKGRYLDPENFSKELVLNFNLGPLKDLDGLIDEVLALDSAKSYLRKQVTIGRTATGDLNKSAALATFQKKSEKSLIFQHHFGNPAPNRD
jgi:hypothetical protein